MEEIKGKWLTYPSESTGSGRTIIVTTRTDIDKFRANPRFRYSTGDGLREWGFYTLSLHIFQRKLNEALAPFPLLPLQFDAEEDPEWESYTSVEE